MEDAGRIGALAGEGRVGAARGAPGMGMLLPLASDERLVARVRAGSEAAFAVMYERHCRGLLSFCRHMLGSREEAEDAVQQTWANAYRAIVSGGDRELRLRPWLYRIARNQCISCLRARRPEQELPDQEPSPLGLTDEVLQRADLRVLLLDLAGLPAEQREALVLSELHDNSHAEVAQILDCDRAKVKSLVFQARTSLIKSRAAREVSCDEVREQLAVLRGGSLRRTVVRRHLTGCEGCRWYREEVRRQRAALALVLPVVPSAVLKGGAAAVIGTAGVKASAGAAGTVAGAASTMAATGGATAASGAATTSGAAAGLGISGGVLKGIAATLAVTTAAAGGAAGVQMKRHATDHAPASATVQTDTSTRTAPNPPMGGNGAAPSRVSRGSGPLARSKEHAARPPAPARPAATNTEGESPLLAVAPAPPGELPATTPPPAAVPTPAAEPVRTPAAKPHRGAGPTPPEHPRAQPPAAHRAPAQRVATRRRALARREEAAAIRRQDRARGGEPLRQPPQADRPVEAQRRVPGPRPTRKGPRRPDPQLKVPAPADAGEPPAG